MDEAAARQSRQNLLSAAVSIGMRLCRDAVWTADGESCSWTGAQVLDLNDRDSPVVVGPLGGDLYGGSAGIGFFLSQLNRATPQAIFQATARGALHHAARWVSALPATSSISLFSGKLGLGYLLAQCDFADPSLRDASTFFLEFAHEQFHHDPDSFVLDIINGAAGAILALLSLERSTGTGPYLNFAIELGSYICASAEWTENYCVWGGMQAAGFASLPLAGYAHGASGIAHALLTLFARTGDSDYLIAARGAYAYEDTLYDPRRRNWLDLRFLDTLDEARLRAETPVAWCHGAPGIALSRKAASRFDPEQAGTHEQALRDAVATTKDALERAESQPHFDTTFCHGICGFIGTLITDGRNDERHDSLGLWAAESLFARYGADGNWPSGVPGGGYSPSLMVGIAGVGLTFLRLAQCPLVELPGLC
jgi:lantibiotic modifying enzyme